MKLSVLILTTMAVGIPTASFAEEPAMRCDIGPVNRNYGNVPWLVYSCADNRSVVIVSAPGSPAMPFMFSLMFQGGMLHVNGEGTGSKDITDAAFKEISALSQADIAELVAQTKSR